MRWTRNSDVIFWSLSYNEHRSVLNFVFIYCIDEVKMYSIEDPVLQCIEMHARMEEAAPQFQ
jgi:hypothetical protein